MSTFGFFGSNPNLGFYFLECLSYLPWLMERLYVLECLLYALYLQYIIYCISLVYLPCYVGLLCLGMFTILCLYYIYYKCLQRCCCYQVSSSV